MHMSDTLTKFSVVAIFFNFQRTEEQFVKANSDVFDLYLTLLLAMLHYLSLSRRKINMFHLVVSLLHYTLRKIHCINYFIYFDCLLHTSSEDSRLNGNCRFHSTP
jgi:hypothetical protein